MMLCRALYDGKQINRVAMTMTATSAPAGNIPAPKTGPAEPRIAVSRGFRIDSWTVEPGLNRVSRAGQTIALEPKVMAVLVYLAERPGMLVTRQELDRAVWSGMVVGYDALTGAIQKLRRAFDDDPRHPRIIATVSKKGYRLIAPVEQPGESDAGAAPVGGRETARSRRRPGSGPVRVILVLTAVLAVAGAIWLVPRETAQQAVPQEAATANSIAVLPFENLSGDPAQEYFADGITDDLTTGLAKYPDLLVIARDSAFLYKDPSPRSLAEIADKLAVRYILHGSVRRSGKRLWINTQLIDTDNTRVSWAESFEGSLDGVFALQDRIARDVAANVTVASDAAGKGTAPRRQTRSPDAYDSFLRGRQYFYLYASKEENLKARALFEAAIRYDPDYALAYAMLGWSYAYDALNGWGEDRETSLRRALEFANKAISLNESLPVAFFVTGLAYRELGEYIKALVEAEKAIEKDPSYANAHLLLATLLVHAGRPEEGLERIRKAMLINPHHPYNYTLHLGQALYILGRYDEAVAAFEQGIASNPASERLHVWLAAACAQAGDMECAEWEVTQILTIDPGFSLQRIGDTFPFKVPADRERILEGLRKAGLS
jgi:adenylate cyclase